MLDVFERSGRHRAADTHGWSRFALRFRGEGTAARRAWRKSYVRRAVVGDALCGAAAGAVGYISRFGAAGFSETGYELVIAAMLPVVWVLAMLAARAYEERFLWMGAEEFHRVISAAALLLATVGTVSWGLKLEVARGFVVVALPLTLVLTLALRYAHRKWLHAQRRRGQFMQTTLLVGHRGGVEALDQQIDREAYHGYRVVGCCLPAEESNAEEDAFNGLPILGDLDHVSEVVQRYGIDTVAVLPSPELDGARLRRLGWALEKTPAELLLAPALTEIVGTRIAIRSVCGLPLLHMDRPELTGLRRIAKEALDRVAAISALVLLSPVLAAIAVAIRLTSPGPGFFRQERIGREGRTFQMLKFRTMVPDAEGMVCVLESDSDTNVVLFKRHNDPRVTRIGRILRRYSIDELPQLINVLKGQMSLVGPRPPLQSEVERYGFDMHRRFIVKPGMTGLWQVSGRSDLSWDDSVRIDVRYVESWSLSLDLMIMWKTVGAVLRGRGAY